MYLIFVQNCVCDVQFILRLKTWLKKKHQTHTQLFQRNVVLILNIDETTAIKQTFFFFFLQTRQQKQTMNRTDK